MTMVIVMAITTTFSISSMLGWLYRKKAGPFKKAYLKRLNNILNTFPSYSITIAGVTFVNTNDKFLLTEPLGDLNPTEAIQNFPDMFGKVKFIKTGERFLTYYEADLTPFMKNVDEFETKLIECLAEIKQVYVYLEYTDNARAQKSKPNGFDINSVRTMIDNLDLQ